MTEINRRQALSALGTVSLASLLAACQTGEPARLVLATTPDGDGCLSLITPDVTA